MIGPNDFDDLLDARTSAKAFIERSVGIPKLELTWSMLMAWRTHLFLYFFRYCVFHKPGNSWGIFRLAEGSKLSAVILRGVFTWICGQPSSAC